MEERKMFERSKWEFGVASVKRDGMLYGMGYTKEEVNRPYIAVVNSWNEYNPGHVHLREVAQRAAAEHGVAFLYRDFRPYFRAGQERARELGFYIQKYCGCVFSEEERYLKKNKIIP